MNTSTDNKHNITMNSEIENKWNELQASRAKYIAKHNIQLKEPLTQEQFEAKFNVLQEQIDESREKIKLKIARQQMQQQQQQQQSCIIC